MNVEMPRDEIILQAMIMDFQHLPELENSQVVYQVNTLAEPRNRIYLEHYDA
jgi:hypothetical protein